MNNLLPLYKWTGGKRKEIKIFSEYYPDFVKNKKDYTYIEPFFGGGAVYWNLNNSNNIINDIDEQMMIFLKVMKDYPNELINLVEDYSSKIREITELEKNELISIKDAKDKRGLFYYEWRNKDRKNGLKNLSELEIAFRFFIVNQLAFNGMRRFNSKGEFNIPYGNYKSFNINFTDEHQLLLKNTSINNGSYKEIMLNNDNENTFIYLDPPYTREFNEYSFDNPFGNKEQIELSNIFKSMKNAKIMLIINKDEFIEELYKDYIKSSYSLKYSTNIKNRYDNNVEHLIITNY